ncbi:MAG: ribose-phosphate diphosphokinase [Patescibacteria group bacterium]|nr:ribose-phosphate diphosphokinase [Patescibacteria group bacterium]
MFLFTFPLYEQIAKALDQLPGITFSYFSVNRFPNQEMFITTQDSVAEKDCFILGSIAPPDQQLISTLLLAHTLKTEGAREVSLVLPYLAYSRQDKKELGESFTTAWIGQIFQASKVDQVITVDVHSPLDKRLFPMPLISLSLAKVFAEEINNLGLVDATLVAPDEGAINRIRAVEMLLGTRKPITYFKKERTPNGLELTLHGEVCSKVVIIDDILDTGATLVACSEKLKAVGVKRIIIMVAHGLFIGNLWQRLWPLGVEQVYCTDTIPPDLQPVSDKIIILPATASLLQEELRKQTV